MLEQTHEEPSAPPTAAEMGDKPTIPAGTKFRKGGFKSSQDKTPDPAPHSATPVDQNDPPEPVVESLPQEFSFESPEPGAEVTEPVIEEVEPVAASEDDIVIGDKVFKDKKEAWAYAQELERQNLANDAFRQGIEAAQLSQNSNLNLTPQKPPEPAKIPDEYYTDPAAFFQKREQQMAAQVNQAIEKKIQQINMHQATMQKFWTDNPDLARNEEIKDIANNFIIRGTSKYANVETDKALKLIAGETRAYLSKIGVTTLPTKPLPSNSKPVASSGTSSAPPRPKPDEKPLNMVQQMKNIKNKRFDSRRKA